MLKTTNKKTERGDFMANLTFYDLKKIHIKKETMPGKFQDLYYDAIFPIAKYKKSDIVGIIQNGVIFTKELNLILHGYFGEPTASGRVLHFSDSQKRQISISANFEILEDC